MYYNTFIDTFYPDSIFLCAQRHFTLETLHTVLPHYQAQQMQEALWAEGFISCIAAVI